MNAIALQDKARLYIRTYNTDRHKLSLVWGFTPNQDEKALSWKYIFWSAHTTQYNSGFNFIRIASWLTGDWLSQFEDVAVCNGWRLEIMYVVTLLCIALCSGVVSVHISISSCWMQSPCVSLIHISEFWSHVPRATPRAMALLVH